MRGSVHGAKGTFLRQQRFIVLSMLMQRGRRDQRRTFRPARCHADGTQERCKGHVGAEPRIFPHGQIGVQSRPIVHVRATHTPWPLLHPRHARQEMPYNTCLHSHIVIHIHGDFDFLTRLKRRHAQEGA